MKAQGSRRAPVDIAEVVSGSSVSGARSSCRGPRGPRWASGGGVHS